MAEVKKCRVMLRWTAKQPHIKLLFTGGYHSVCWRIIMQCPCEVIVLLSWLHITMWHSKNMSRDRGFALSAAPELLGNRLGVRLLSHLKVHTNLQTSVFVLWYFMHLTGIGLVSQCDFVSLTTLSLGIITDVAYNTDWFVRGRVSDAEVLSLRRLAFFLLLNGENKWKKCKNPARWRLPLQW